MLSYIHKKYTGNLSCFSPPVMMATFAVEVVAALYVLYKYRASQASRLIILMLVGLATFQLAEYMVCQTAIGLSSLDWARVGYVAITALPPLGIHLALTIAGKKNTPLLVMAYGTGLAFATFFLTYGQGLTASQCLGNYVIFGIAPKASFWYSAYYYGWLFVGLCIAGYYGQKHKQAKRRSALNGFVWGYAAFIAPTALVNSVDPSTIAGIPSIMCGFAVIFAFVLLFWVAPHTLTENPSAKTIRFAK